MLINLAVDAELSADDRELSGDQWVSGRKCLIANVISRSLSWH